MSDRVVQAELRDGVTSVDELAARCGAGSDCGGCHRRLQQLLAVAVPTRPAATVAA